MDFLQILKLINYALVLIYGLFLSVMIAGCWKEQRQRRFVILSCPFLLLIQGIGCLVAGVDAVRQLYLKLLGRWLRRSRFDVVETLLRCYPLVRRER